jgi:hypothetical protein
MRRYRGFASSRLTLPQVEETYCVRINPLLNFPSEQYALPQ